jgi:hypothetical protein
MNHAPGFKAKVATAADADGFEAFAVFDVDEVLLAQGA